jgi:hypothetical protein
MKTCQLQRQINRKNLPFVAAQRMPDRPELAGRCFHKRLNRLFAREDTHEIAIRDSDLINVRIGPLCGLKSDIVREVPQPVVS